MPRFIPCDDCEGTGDYHRRDPQPDDPYLVTRRYGVACPACEGEGSIEIEDEPVEEEDLDEMGGL